MRIPGFCGGSCPELSSNVNAERTVNLYPHAVGGGTPKGQPVMYRVPGFVTFSDMDGDSTRGLFEINGRCFAVAGTTFYEVDSSGTETSRGTVVEDTNPATLSSNGTAGNQVFITSGGEGYIFNLSTDAFTIITDTDFPSGNALMGAFSDGYFVVLNGETGVFQLSALEDGLTWDALDEAQVSQLADLVSALITSNREIWLFGRTNTSVWYNSGNEDFPFQPTQTVLQQGIVAPFSAQRIDNTIMWVGQSEDGAGVVYRAQGLNAPLRVSTHALEQIWSTYSTMTDAVAYTYVFQGHPFYVLWFPAAEDVTDNDNAKTWVYDVSTNLWHERGLWDTEAAVWIPDVGRCHAYAFGKHLIGDRRTGAIYEERADTYDVELVAV